VSTGEPARDRASAIREIRAAEAARVLGLLDAKPLPAKAEKWMQDGVDSANVRALAGATTSGANPTDQILAELLAAIAREHGVAFASLQEARSIHAEQVVSLMGTGGDFGAQVFGLSNSVTDEMVARLRRLVARFRPGADQAPRD
jgi:hypothetical protein